MNKFSAALIAIVMAVTIITLAVLGACIDAKAKQYAMLEVDNAANDNLIAAYFFGYDNPLAKFEIDDDTTSDVAWYGEVR